MQNIIKNNITNFIKKAIYNLMVLINTSILKKQEEDEKNILKAIPNETTLKQNEKSKSDNQKFNSDKTNSLENNIDTQQILNGLDTKKKYFSKKESNIDEMNNIYGNSGLMNEELTTKSFIKTLFETINISDSPHRDKLRTALILFLTTFVCISINMISVTLVAFFTPNLIEKPVNNIAYGIFGFMFGFFVEIFLFKTFCSYIKKHNLIKKIMFFSTYLIHCCFVVYNIFGLPSHATSGIFNIIEQLNPKGNIWLFLLNIISVLFWFVSAILTIAVFNRMIQFNHSIKPEDSEIRVPKFLRFITNV